MYHGELVEVRTLPPPTTGPEYQNHGLYRKHLIHWAIPPALFFLFFSRSKDSQNYRNYKLGEFSLLIQQPIFLINVFIEYILISFPALISTHILPNHHQTTQLHTFSLSL